MHEFSALHRELDEDFRRRYRLLRELGAGGAGVVHLAEQLDLDRRVAVKFLRPAPGKGENDEALRRFLVEAEALSRIRHEHIVEIFGVGRTGELAYMVLEYLDGGSLAKLYADEGPLPWRRARDHAVAVGRALIHAHAHGLLHRDVKPSNVLLGGGGLVKLADFGLVRWAEARRSAVTRDGVIMGSPLYLSPEQARGEGVGPASDVYSLAILLYEGVAGRCPFEGAPVRVLIQHHSEAPPPPSTFVRNLPRSLEDVLLKALQKDPAERQPSMAAFVEELEALGRGTGADRRPSALRSGRRVPRKASIASVEATPPSGPSSGPGSSLPSGCSVVRPASPVLRRRALSVALAGAILLLGGIVLGLRGGRPSVPSSSPVATRRVAARPEGELHLRLRRLVWEGRRWVMRCETRADAAGALVTEGAKGRMERAFRADGEGQVVLEVPGHELEGGLRIAGLRLLDGAGEGRSGRFDWGSFPARLAQALDLLDRHGLTLRLLEAARTGGLDERRAQELLREERACRLWEAFTPLARGWFADAGVPFEEKERVYRVAAPLATIDAFLDAHRLPAWFEVEKAVEPFVSRRSGEEADPQPSAGTTLVATFPAMREILFPANLPPEAFAVKWAAMRRFAPDVEGRGPFDLTWPAVGRGGGRPFLEFRLRQTPPDFVIRFVLNGRLPLYHRFGRKQGSEIGSFVQFLAAGEYAAGWGYHRLRTAFPRAFLREEGENVLRVEALAIPGAEASVFPLVKWVALGEEAGRED